MRFEKQAIISLGALCCFAHQFCCDAFVLQQNSRILSTTFLVPASSNSRIVNNQKYNLSTRLFAVEEEEDDDDDDTNPLGKGLNSVSWLPSVVGQSGEEISGLKEGSEVLPLFPLG